MIWNMCCLCYKNVEGSNFSHPLFISSLLTYVQCYGNQKAIISNGTNTPMGPESKSLSFTSVLKMGILLSHLESYSQKPNFIEMKP